nr:hypothetical protein BdHM001_36300 [Bdellovibrio sp. HM001]
MELANRVTFMNRDLGNIIPNEDLKQEYLTRLLEGLHKRATVGQAVIDIYRVMVANSKTSDYEARRNAATGPASLEDWTPFADPTESIENRLAISSLTKHLPERDQYIINKILSGDSQRDVADELGLTESRLSQIYLRIIERLKEIAARKPFIKGSTEGAENPLFATTKAARKRRTFAQKSWICAGCGHRHTGQRRPKVCPKCKKPKLRKT